VRQWNPVLWLVEHLALQLRISVGLANRRFLVPASMIIRPMTAIMTPTPTRHGLLIKGRPEPNRVPDTRHNRASSGQYIRVALQVFMSLISRLKVLLELISTRSMPRILGQLLCL
jgi:hypothetical protein